VQIEERILPLSVVIAAPLVSTITTGRELPMPAAFSRAQQPPPPAGCAGCG